MKPPVSEKTNAQKAAGRQSKRALKKDDLLAFNDRVAEYPPRADIYVSPGKRKRRG